MLLQAVTKSNQFFELHMVLVNHLGRPTAPVEGAVVDVPPADVAARVPLQSDDRQRLVLEEDARARGLMRQLGGPPASVSLGAVPQPQRAIATRQCRLELFVHAVEVGATATENAGREAKLADGGLEVLGAEGVGAEDLVGECQQLLPARVADGDRALVAVEQVTDVLERGRGALGLLRVAAQPEPREDADRQLDVGGALLLRVRCDEEVIDVHASVHAEGGQELHYLSGEGAGEGRRELEAQRQPRVAAVRPGAVCLVALLLVRAPLRRRRARAVPLRGHARVLEDNEVPEVGVQGQAREEL